jgi:hypothetical protein
MVFDLLVSPSLPFCKRSFELEHQPGELGLSDFTKLKQVQVTISGQPFEHLLYHYRLAYSG